jgi:hypothetical protein
MGLTEWRLSYGPVALGVIDHRGDRLKKPARHARACGQRRPLPTGSTGATATTDLNETKNVLPMSPVRSVAYVPGCSG